MKSSPCSGAPSSGVKAPRNRARMGCRALLRTAPDCERSRLGTRPFSSGGTPGRMCTRSWATVEIQPYESLLYSAAGITSIRLAGTNNCILGPPALRVGGSGAGPSGVITDGLSNSCRESPRFLSGLPRKSTYAFWGATFHLSEHDLNLKASDGSVALVRQFADQSISAPDTKPRCRRLGSGGRTRASNRLQRRSRCCRYGADKCRVISPRSPTVRASTRSGSSRVAR